MTTRRRFSAGVCASMLFGYSGYSRADTDTLSALFGRKNLYFGTAIRIEQIERDQNLRNVLLRECDVITPEVALKWDALEPALGQFSFNSMDSLSNFALANRKRIHGHTLLWHTAVPPWAGPAIRERNGWDFVTRYFEGVISRYGHAISHWDVINEPIDTGHRMDGLRNSIFLQAFGSDYIVRALWEARRLAPQAKLMINEFGLEYDLTIEEHRRYHLLKLIERIRQAGAPLDGIGLQAHLNLSKGPLSAGRLSKFLQHLADFGLFVVVSELDVKEYDYTLPVERRDSLVADEIRRYLDIVLSQPAVRGVTTWGLSDRDSWLKVSNEDYARYPQAWRDGTSPGYNRGLPFDAAMQPKAMYRAIASSVRQRHWR
jgi:endo-1,4-beta-xylanase